MYSPNRRSLALVSLIFIVAVATPGTAQPQLPAEAYTILLSEDFSSGLSGWTVIDGGAGGGPAPTWTTDNPGGRTPPLSSPFAICDSDHHGFGEMDEELISPVVDATGFDPLTLSFNHSFRWYSGGWSELADVDVRSAATGGVWVNVARFEGGDAEGAEVIDLGPWAAVDLQVRFHYFNGNWEYWWAVDDVLISGAAILIFSDGFESGSTAAWENGAWPGD